MYVTPEWCNTKLGSPTTALHFTSRGDIGDHVTLLTLKTLAQGGDV